jgi:hypothetical protein
MVAKPSISVNKLAEYIESKGARQRQLLRDRKYPDEEFNLGMFHREASEAVSQYIAGGAIDTSIIEKQHKILSQLTPEKIGTARRINSNIDVIERFLDMLDDLDLCGGEAELAPQGGGKLTYHNVEISVRPEIIIRGKDKKGNKLIGAIKLHFSTTRPFNDDMAGYVSAVVQEYLKTNYANDVS